MLGNSAALFFGHFTFADVVQNARFAVVHVAKDDDDRRSYLASLIFIFFILFHVLLDYFVNDKFPISND